MHDFQMEPKNYIKLYNELAIEIDTVIYHFRCARYFWYLLVFEAFLILFE